MSWGPNRRKPRARSKLAIRSVGPPHSGHLTSHAAAAGVNRRRQFGQPTGVITDPFNRSLRNSVRPLLIRTATKAAFNLESPRRHPKRGFCVLRGRAMPDPFGGLSRGGVRCRLHARRDGHTSIPIQADPGCSGSGPEPTHPARAWARARTADQTQPALGSRRHPGRRARRVSPAATITAGQPPTCWALAPRLTQIAVDPVIVRLQAEALGPRKRWNVCPLPKDQRE
jgi:hypothetical protein